MSLPIRLRPEAQADLTSARDWYELQQAGLGGAFLDAVNQLLTRIGEMPGLYPVVFRELRRAKLRRFPYLVYYRVLPDHIEVLGLLHGSRHPEVWQERA